VKVSEIVFRK